MLNFTTKVSMSKSTKAKDERVNEVKLNGDRVYYTTSIEDTVSYNLGSDGGIKARLLIKNLKNVNIPREAIIRSKAGDFIIYFLDTSINLYKSGILRNPNHKPNTVIMITADVDNYLRNVVGNIISTSGFVSIEEYQITSSIGTLSNAPKSNTHTSCCPMCESKDNKIDYLLQKIKTLEIELSKKDATIDELNSSINANNISSISEPKNEPSLVEPLVEPLVKNSTNVAVDENSVLVEPKKTSRRKKKINVNPNLL